MGKPGIGRKTQLDFIKECFQIYIWCMLQHMSSCHTISILPKDLQLTIFKLLFKVKSKKKHKKNLPHNNFLQSLSTHSKRRTKRKNPLKSPLVMK